VLGFVGVSVHRPKFQLQLSINVFIDIAFTLILVHAGGGLKSGLALMLFVTIAAAGLISRGRYALFHAALAAIGVQLVSAFEILYGDPQGGDFCSRACSVSVFRHRYSRLQPGTLCLGKRAFGDGARIDLANLARVNQLVIRDLADGIVVIDDQDCIRSGNLRAELLFGSIATDGMQHLDAYSPCSARPCSAGATTLGGLPSRSAHRGAIG
jgi:two-component system sensor histidine kinase PilS (NtrC family)